MIQVEEKKLEAAIQIILGIKGIYTDELEKDLIDAIKALSICSVGIELPTDKEMILERNTRAFKEYKEDEILNINAYRYGFTEAYLWIKNRKKSNGN
jgi:hypothetical protein